MLHLQACVHLQKEEALILPRHKFDSPRTVITNGLRQCHRLLTHRLAGLFIQERRRRFFDDFLVAALNGAFALAQIDHIAVLIAQHLNFDMARIGDELFHKHPVIAKG